MQIDFNVKMKNLDGTPIPTGLPLAVDKTSYELLSEDQAAKYEPKGEVYKLKKDAVEFLTLKSVVTNALINRADEDRSLSNEESFHRGMLAQKIYSAEGPLHLSVDDISKLKPLISRVYGPLIYFQAIKILDPPAKEEPQSVNGEEQSALVA